MCPYVFFSYKIQLLQGADCALVECWVLDEETELQKLCELFKMMRLVSHEGGWTLWSVWLQNLSLISKVMMSNVTVHACVPKLVLHIGHCVQCHHWMPMCHLGGWAFLQFLAAPFSHGVEILSCSSYFSLWGVSFFLVYFF